MSIHDTTRRVTAADIARSVGVSRATVGFVLNDTPGQTISAATRERVLEAANRLGYRPHRAARALASGGQSRIVLLVLPDWPIEYSMGTHLDEASQTLDEAGYSLVTWTPHPHGHARPLWESLQPDVVMGMAPFSIEQQDQIRVTGARLVVPDADPGEAPSFNTGPALQVAHLAARGHRSLVFADPDDPRLGALADQRSALATRIAAARGLELRRMRMTPDSLAHLSATGVVAYNDDVAAEVVGLALRAGVRVPQDLAVVGHDEAPSARLLLPALTTVHVDTAGLGRYLAALALSTAEDLPAPPPPEVQVSLVVRESS